MTRKGSLKQEAPPPSLNCPACGYSLDGLPDQGECPECGELYWKPILLKNKNYKQRKPPLALLYTSPAIIVVLIFLNAAGLFNPVLGFWLGATALVTSVISVAAASSYKSNRPRNGPIDSEDRHIASLGGANLIILLFVLFIASVPMLLVGACMFA